MSENEEGAHGHKRPSSDSTIERHRPYWTRAHKDWKFWIVLIGMVAAMLIYVVSQDLSIGPRGQQREPVPEVAP
jgi:hypothetical protein